MPAAKQTAIILLIVAALSLAASAQQQNPCLASQPTPPPSPNSPNSQDELQKQNDVSSRSSQLNCVERQAGKVPPEIAARHAAQHEALRSQVQSLKGDSDSLVEMAVEFRDYVDQSNSTELPPEQIHELQQIVAVSHNIRETLAGGGLPNQQRKRGHDSFAGDHQALLQQADQCLSLATDLKKTMDTYLQQNNQNTVSAVELKDKTISSAINNTAEKLEALAFELKESAAAANSQSDATTGKTSAKQSSSQEASGKDVSLVLKASTRMVLVDAVVTDAQGKPVSGLKAEDFTIIEDGKKQTIKAFGARSAAQADQKPSPAPRLPPGLFTNVPDLRAEDGTPTIILVDFLNTATSDQATMQNQLANYIKAAGRKRNVCIYALGSQLRLLQDFTDDTQTLLEALGKTSTQASAANQDANFKSGDMTVQGGSSASPAGDANGSIAFLLSEIKELQGEVSSFDFDYRFFTTMDAFKRIAHNIAGYPGRKSLIWLSATFPLGFDQLKQRNYSDEFHRTASLLTDAQVAVYPVDPQGLVGNYFLPDASAGAGGPVGTRAGRQIVNQSTTTGNTLQALHYTMNYVAGWTGGRSFYGRNDLEQAIESAVEDGSAYYALGYYPAKKKWNGEFRKIEVRVAGDGLRARHRDGYFATDARHHTPVEHHVAQVEFVTALRFESPAATMLPLVAQVIPPGKDAPEVTVEFGVDPHAVAFALQSDNLQHAGLDFGIVAFDSRGNQVSSKFHLVTTHLNPERYAEIMRGRLAYREKITLPPGRYLLKMGVRDISSDVIGTVAGKVEVAAPN